MNFDPQTYFILVLSGFVTVWTFRHVTKSKKIERSDSFEYLGLSVVWGLIELAIFEFLIKDPDKISFFLKNPYAYGAVQSLFGAFYGFIGGLIVNWFKKKLR